MYYYPNGGQYFGVTLINFVGWFFVGTLTLLVTQRLLHKLRQPGNIWTSGALAAYAGVFLFNLALTAWIREWPLLWASGLVALMTLTLIGLRVRTAH